MSSSAVIDPSPENTVMDLINLEIEADQEQWRELLAQLHDLNKRTAQKKAIKKSKESLQQSWIHEND